MRQALRKKQRRCSTNVTNSERKKTRQICFGRNISVDRAILRNYNPYETLNQEGEGANGGVVGLITGEVRATEGLVRNDSKGKEILRFTVDVEHVPVPNNYSHAEIHGNPDFTDKDKKRAFRRLRHRLAYLVEKR